MSVELFTDDDWDIEYTVKKDGAAYDVSAATNISASVVDSDGIDPQTVIAAVTCDSGATGADWANGVVIIEIPAASTGVTTLGQVFIELQVTLGGKKQTWPRKAIIIKKGTIA